MDHRLIAARETIERQLVSLERMAGLFPYRADIYRAEAAGLRAGWAAMVGAFGLPAHALFCSSAVPAERIDRLHPVL